MSIRMISNDKWRRWKTNHPHRQGNGLTIDHLEKAMRSQYRIVKGRKSQTNGKELSLTGFHGKCYKCNKVSHRANK